MGRFGYGFGTSGPLNNIVILSGGGGLPVPVNTVPPVISGSQVNGSLMSSTTGTWDNSPSSYAYQWTRDGVPISGATSNTYTTVPADGLAELRCEVIATNATGSSAPAISNVILIDEYVAFVSTWDTELSDASASPSQNIVLPMSAGPQVDWGDGTINNLNSHVYAAPGQYTITIDNTNSGFRFDNGGDKAKIIDVSQCNGLNITANSVFRGCTNLEWSATDAPNITSTNLDSIFLGCTSMDGDLSSWDVSNATRMVNFFFAASSFTGTGLENWNVGSCTNFTQMFFGANSFNAPIGVWNMSSATSISGMFRSNNAFNQDLNNWDISNVQQMNHLFAGCPYTHDLDGWNNKVSNVTTIHAMFSGNNYNGDITGWVFGPSIQDVSWIFAGNNSFNRDISGWSVGTATNFSNMFGGAGSFNQNLGTWDFGSATNMTTMLDNCGMDTANYDALLVGLNGQAASLTPGLALGAQGRTYTTAGAGGTARTALLGAPALMSFVGDSGV